MDRLAHEYVSGGSYHTLGRKYKVSGSTIRNRLKAWADERQMSWPLKSHDQARRGVQDVVSAEITRLAIHDACRRYRISQGTLAKLCGVGLNHMHKISSGHQPRVYRRTQGKILETIFQLDAGELTVEPEVAVLPMPVRDRCAKGHPYTGRVSSKGQRQCATCYLAKDRRRQTG